MPTYSVDLICAILENNGNRKLIFEMPINLILKETYCMCTVTVRLLSNSRDNSIGFVKTSPSLLSDAKCLEYVPCA